MILIVLSYLIVIIDSISTACILPRKFIFKGTALWLFHGPVSVRFSLLKLFLTKDLLGVLFGFDLLASEDLFDDA